MRHFQVVSLIALAFAGVACSSESGVSPGSSHVEKRGAQIINGNLDTTRQAVVAIVTSASLCTGTIIQKDDTTGVAYVLTAAHCVTPDAPTHVLQGNDWVEPTRVYSVIDYKYHPGYDSGGGSNLLYDIAMIRVSGANASTPVIPLDINTNVTAGTSIMSVGYGVTGPSDDTKRYNITKTVSEVDSPILMYSLSGGGICSGDSGGPVLSTGANQAVYAVHSAVDNASSSNCWGNGYSILVKPYYASFIAPILGEEVEPSCDLCVESNRTGACAGAVDACLDNQPCLDLVSCLNDCTSDSCVDDCASAHSAGISLLNALFQCDCTQCATECATECQGSGEGCGLAFQNTTCESCHSENCCEQAQVCADDATCNSCARSASPGPNCTANAAYQSWLACLGNSCASECGVSGSGGSGNAGGAGGSSNQSAGGSGGDGLFSGGAGGATTGGVGGSGGPQTSGNDGDSGSSTLSCSYSAENGGSSNASAWLLLGFAGFGLVRRRAYLSLSAR